MADRNAINVANLGLRLFHGKMLFLHCATHLPSMDMSMELGFLKMLTYMVELIYSIPPLLPCVPDFDHLMEHGTGQPISYEGRNVYVDLARTPRRFSLSITLAISPQQNKSIWKAQPECSIYSSEHSHHC